jgi:Dolichyl-phosphate-mannose-protein mannosyltransferase
MRRSGATIRYAAGRLLVLAGGLAAAWSAVTLVTGGFALRAGTLALSSRDPIRPLIVAGALLVAARVLLPGLAFAAAVRLMTGGRGRLAARLAGAAAVAVLICSVAWSTRAAGGSDSSCYVLQAEAFAHGRVTLANPLPGVLPAATSAMFAPTGFVPSRVTPFTAVPICGPGLALAMTAARIAGRDAVFLVVPVCAALAVCLTFLLGRRLDDDLAGAAAALLLATSPVFLYQSVQPMSDVPAAALWLAALVAMARGDQRGQILGGVCASLAVLMRPNVVLIVIPLVLLSFRLKAEAAETKPVVAALRRNVLFLLAAAPGLAVMAWLNAVRYGSPLASGYGSTDALFSLAHVGPNLGRYPRWLLETETPFIAAALFAPWWAWRRRLVAPLTFVALAAVVLTFATYLAYTVFDDWWYIRFLLPALPVLIVLSVVVSLRAFGWLLPSRASARLAAAVVLCVALGAWHLHVAQDRHVFDLQAMESRFAIAGRYAARALPPQAVVLAVQQSGSLRYYGNRPTIAWDAIAPDALDSTLEILRAAGRPPFIALEDAEEPRFRVHFATERAGRLDWPPSAELHGPVRVRFYDPDARDAYLRGVPRATDVIR